MPFCPKCRSEYRDGFEVCATCDGEVKLVAELPKVEALRGEDLSKSRPVGRASSADISRPMELPSGRVIDLLRVFLLGQASELERTLVENGIAAIILPIDAMFPDDNQRFEVRVRNEEYEAAENLLREHFEGAVQMEGTEGTVGETDAETCPACGAHVPLDVEECPECGLNVGGAA